MAAAITWFAGHSGAGFTSGRQIVQYTTRHGIAGIWIPLVVWAFLGWFVYWSVEYGRLVRARTYREFAKSFYGKFLGPVMAVFLDFVGVVGGFIVLSVMFAEAAHVGEAFGLNFTLGCFIIAAVCSALAVFGYRFYSFMQSYLTMPLIAMLLLAQTLIIVLNWDYLMHVIRTSGSGGTTFGDMIRSCVAYGGLQSGAYATMITLAYYGGKRWTKKDTIKATWGGAALNCFMHLFNVMMVYCGYPWVNDTPLVTMSLISALPPGIRSWLLPYYQIMLMLAILTTAVGPIYGILVRWGNLGSKYIPHTKVRHTVFGLGYAFLAVSLSSIGLIALVSRGYGFIGNMRTPSTVIPISLLVIWRSKTMKKKAEAGEDIYMCPPVEEKEAAGV